MKQFKVVETCIDNTSSESMSQFLYCVISLRVIYFRCQSIKLHIFLHLYILFVLYQVPLTRSVVFVCFTAWCVMCRCATRFYWK